MWRRFIPRRRRLAVIAVLLMERLYGLPGYLEDGQWWRTTLATVTSLQLYDYLFWSVGTVSVIYAFAPQRFIDWMWLSLGLQSRESPLRPEQRIYTKRTVGGLLKAARNLTDVDVAKFAEPYLGKWIRVQSTIRNISQDDNFYYVLLGKWFEPTPCLTFDKNKWGGNIEMMGQGERLAAMGRITKIDQLALYMDRCDIIEEEEGDDQLRLP